MFIFNYSHEKGYGGIVIASDLAEAREKVKQLHPELHNFNVWLKENYVISDYILNNMNKKETKNEF